MIHGLVMSTFVEYREIVTDPAHVAAELTFVLLFDGLLAGLLWPLAKRAVRRHDERSHSAGG